MNVGAKSRVELAWSVLDRVLDPEVPVLSVRDLGIVRDVVEHDDRLEVVLTPTYSGCPAIEAIERSVVEALEGAELGPVSTTLRRAPAWTTDWISESGRRKLRDYGIAPPHRVAGASTPPTGGSVAASVAPIHVVPSQRIECPRCGSADTQRLSAFGATACKALYRCAACREPFEHFKAI